MIIFTLKCLTQNLSKGLDSLKYTMKIELNDFEPYIIYIKIQCTKLYE